MNELDVVPALTANKCQWSKIGIIQVNNIGKDWGETPLNRVFREGFSGEVTFVTLRISATALGEDTPVRLSWRWYEMRPRGGQASGHTRSQGFIPVQREDAEILDLCF